MVFLSYADPHATQQALYTLYDLSGKYLRVFDQILAPPLKSPDGYPGTPSDLRMFA